MKTAPALVQLSGFLLQHPVQILYCATSVTEMDFIESLVGSVRYGVD